MSRTVNVDRMRRHTAQSQAAAEATAREVWLRSLTPEHRAVHERPVSYGCGFCVSAAAQRMRRSVDSMVRDLERRRSARDFRVGGFPQTPKETK